MSDIRKDKAASSVGSGNVKNASGGPSSGAHGPGPHGRHGKGERAKDAKGTSKKLLKVLKPYLPLFAVAFLCAFIGVLCVSFAPKVLGSIITAILDGTKKGALDWNLINRTILILAGLYFTNFVFRLSQHMLLVQLSQRIVRNLKSDINAKLDRLPLSYFDGRTQGEIMSRITNDVDTIDQSIQEGISQAIISVFTIVCLLVIMLTTNVLMTLVSLVTIPIILVVVAQVVKHTQRFFLDNQKYLGELNGHVEQLYGGHSIVKTFNHEDQAIEQFDAINDNLYNAGWKSNFYSSVIFPLTGFAGNLGYVLVIVVGAINAAAGRLSVGDIQAFVQYVKRFNQPIQEVANISNVFQSTLAAAERVFEVLEEPEEVDDGKLSSDPARGDIEFDDVRFSYVPEKPLIEGLNLNVQSGAKIAIVGPTGAGKTTLINLLMRFYDVNGGSIKVDGIDVRDWPRDVLRDQFGMVLQDTWLFEGTVAQNISYGAGTDEVDMDKVRSCARLACADHFIETLPGGYDFVINEEASNISQGEKQLITIARAFMSNPRILILDEATSNVDTRTERLVQQAMEKLMEGRTSFIIAHRLSTIRDANLILVMEKGNIVEQGTHEELLERKSFYYNLYMSQFKGVSDF